MLFTRRYGLVTLIMIMIAFRLVAKQQNALIEERHADINSTDSYYDRCLNHKLSFEINLHIQQTQPGFECCKKTSRKCSSVLIYVLREYKIALNGNVSWLSSDIQCLQLAITLLF